MHKEAVIAIIAILFILLLTQTAAWRVGYDASYDRVILSEGERVDTPHCDRLYNQCIGCGGARVCRHYCYAYEGQCLR